MVRPIEANVRMRIVKCVTEFPTVAASVKDPEEFRKASIWRRMIDPDVYSKNRVKMDSDIKKLLNSLRSTSAVQLDLCEALYLLTPMGENIDAMLAVQKHLMKTTENHFITDSMISITSLEDLEHANRPLHCSIVDGFFDYLRSQEHINTKVNIKFLSMRSFLCEDSVEGRFSLTPSYSHFMTCLDQTANDKMIVPHITAPTYDPQIPDKIIGIPHVILLICDNAEKTVKVFDSSHKQHDKHYHNEGETIMEFLNAITSDKWAYIKEIDSEINDLDQTENECVVAACMRAMEFLPNNSDLFNSSHCRGSQKWFNESRQFMHHILVLYLNKHYINNMFRDNAPGN